MYTHLPVPHYDLSVMSIAHRDQVLLTFGECLKRVVKLHAVNGWH